MSAVPVLVVDDNPANQRLLSYLLGAHGYDVHTAEDAASTMAAIARVRPRAILMDLQLPGTSGLEITKRIKADPATSDIVVIAVTAFAMRGDEQKALAAGCDGYVTKPVDTRALPKLIAERLERS